MNSWHALSALPLLVLAGSVAHESSASPLQNGALQRVAPVDAQPDRQEAGTWREALASDDLDARLHAYEHVVQRARRDGGTREMLEELTRSNDTELAWTARLALREVGRGGGMGFGLVPLAPGQTPRALRWNAPDAGSGLDQLEERVQELERMFQGSHPDGLDALSIPPASGVPGGSSPETQSYRIELGPDGAKIELREMVGGEESVRTFEGESLEEILHANPELKGKVGVGEGLPGLRWRGLEQLEDLQRWYERDGSWPQPGQLGQPPTHILGIEYREPTPEEVESLGLEAGYGLVVERIAPRTIAHLLGLERGDVLVELNANRLIGGEDVSRVLRERLPEADLIVSMIDKRGQRRTLTWRPPTR